MQQQLSCVIKTCRTNQHVGFEFRTLLDSQVELFYRASFGSYMGGCHEQVVPWNIGNIILNVTLALMTPQMNL